MTQRQEYILMKVRESIGSIRAMLDDCMYGVRDRDKMTEKERSRIREAYDLICQANDKL